MVKAAFAAVISWSRFDSAASLRARQYSSQPGNLGFDVVVRHLHKCSAALAQLQLLLNPIILMRFGQQSRLAFVHCSNSNLPESKQLPVRWTKGARLAAYSPAQWLDLAGLACRCSSTVIVTVLQ